MVEVDGAEDVKLDEEGGAPGLGAGKRFFEISQAILTCTAHHFPRFYNEDKNFKNKERNGEP